MKAEEFAGLSLGMKGFRKERVGRKGKGYIAVPAFEGSLAEQKGTCNQTSPIWRTSAKYREWNVNWKRKKPCAKSWSVNKAHVEVMKAEQELLAPADVWGLCTSLGCGVRNDMPTV
eukprot:465702-Pelagomonas_calceolata.AAC.1